ncbi:hypothetical protein ABVT39_017481 [Epinephelus coioides]
MRRSLPGKTAADVAPRRSGELPAEHRLLTVERKRCSERGPGRDETEPDHPQTEPQSGWRGSGEEAKRSLPPVSYDPEPPPRPRTTDGEVSSRRKTGELCPGGLR